MQDSNIHHLWTKNIPVKELAVHVLHAKTIAKEQRRFLVLLLVHLYKYICTWSDTAPAALQCKHFDDRPDFDIISPPLVDY